MKINFRPQINNKPAFKGIYATMGSIDDNNKIFDKLASESEYYNEHFSNTRLKKIKQKNNISLEGVYQYEALHLTPSDAPKHILLIGTNENATDLINFQRTNGNNYDIDLYTGEKISRIDLKAQEYYNRGEIDNFLDCLLEKRKKVDTIDTFDEANRIVKAIRKQASLHFGFVPILDANSILEHIQKKRFDFVKGILIKR